MAVRASELRLALIVQNQASAALSRIGRDIRSLSSATEAANRSQLAHARELKALSRVADQKAEIAALQAGVPLQAAITAAVASRIKMRDKLYSAGTRDLSLQKQLFDIETRRMKLQNALADAEARRGAIQTQVNAARQARQALVRATPQPFQAPARPTNLGTFLSAGVVAEQNAKKAKEAQKAIREHGIKVDEATAAYDEQRKVLERAESEATILSRSLQSLDMQEEIVNRNSVELTRTVGRLKNQIREATESVIQMKRDFRNGLVDQDALHREQVKLQELTAQMHMYEAAAKSAKRAEDQRSIMRAEATGRTVSHIGRAATFAGGVNLAIAGGLGNAAANYDKLITQAATQTTRSLGTGSIEEVVKNANTLNEGILKQLQEFPATADEMAKASYELFSSMDLSQFKGGGNDAMQQGLGLLKKFNQVAVAGNTDLATATESSVTAINNFKDSGQSLDQILNTMFATIRFGRMNFEQFNTMLNKVAPAANIMNQSLQDVSGAMAILTTRIPSQRQAATGIQRLLQTFSDADVQSGLKKFGIDIVDRVKGRIKPLYEIIAEIKSKEKELGLDQPGGVFPFFQRIHAVGRESGRGNRQSSEAIKAFAVLIQQQKDYAALQKAITGDTNEFTRSLKAMSETPGVAWDVMTNQFKAFAIVIGQEVLPRMLRLGQWIGNVIHWVENLDPKIKSIASKFFVFGSAALLLVGPLMMVIGSLTAFGATLRLLSMDLEGRGGGVIGKLGKLFTLMSMLKSIGVVALGVDFAMNSNEPGLRQHVEAAVLGTFAGKKAAKMLKLGKFAGRFLPVVGTLAAELATSNNKVTGSEDIASKRIENVQRFSDALTNMRKALPKDLVPEWDKLQRTLNKPIDATGGRLSDFDPKVLKERVKIVKDWLRSVKEGDIAKKFMKDAENASMNPLQFLKDFTKNSMKKVAAIQKDELRKMYEDQIAQGVAAAKEVARRRVEAIMQAEKQARQNFGQTVMSMFTGFRDQNQANFGTLFEPAQSDIVGNLLTPIFKDLAQFGVNPPKELLKRNLDGQLKQFKEFRDSLKLLAKKGASDRMIAMLAGMGPEALPAIRTLLTMSKKEINDYFKSFNTAQKAVDDAAYEDTKAKLDKWFTYGVDVVQKIMDGIATGDKEMDTLIASLIAPYEPKVVANAKTVAGREFDAATRAELAAINKAVEEAKKLRHAIENQPGITVTTTKQPAKTTTTQTPKPAPKQPTVPTMKRPIISTIDPRPVVKTAEFNNVLKLISSTNMANQFLKANKAQRGLIGSLTQQGTSKQGIIDFLVMNHQLTRGGALQTARSLGPWQAKKMLNLAKMESKNLLGSVPSELLSSADPKKALLNFVNSKVLTKDVILSIFGKIMQDAASTEGSKSPIKPKAAPVRTTQGVSRETTTTKEIHHYEGNTQIIVPNANPAAVVQALETRSFQLRNRARRNG